MIPKKSAQELGQLYTRLDEIDASISVNVSFIEDQKARLDKMRDMRADVLAKIAEFGGEVDEPPALPAYFVAERTAHPKRAEHGWCIVHDPTPGGRQNPDGTRSFSLRFPVLLLTDYVENPEEVAKSVADALNEARALEDAEKAKAEADRLNGKNQSDDAPLIET